MLAIDSWSIPFHVCVFVAHSFAPTAFQVVLTRRALPGPVRLRKGTPLFQGINLSVSQGKLVALTGPAGSGKSKLLKMLVGDASPTSGQVSRPKSF